MGLSFSCSLDEFDDLEAVLVRSLGLDSGGMRTVLRSISFNGRDSESSIIESPSCRKMMYEGSLSFNGREIFRTPTGDMENKFFSKPKSFKKEDAGNELLRSHASFKNCLGKEVAVSGNRRYQAALRLQKVYKSFRTRRRLADCAVLVEQRWWKLLDFAELKRSSISFFDIEKPETAISRWSRARTRAAKVGKGLSKDEKARKLALQHWLEAIDPRHRYGHNLQFYYVAWLHCDSKQPFFYWLDIGEGKEVNLERCLRSNLQQQCIKYLGPTERKAYEVVVENGIFIYKQSGIVLDTRKSSPDAKWIFVLSVSRTLYVGMKKKGMFQHSSFLAGGATLSAGRLIVEKGVLKAVWPHSGHYLPTEENFKKLMSFLQDNSVDLTNVQKSPAEEEGEAISKAESLTKPTNGTEDESTHFVDAESRESFSQENDNLNETKPYLTRRFHSQLARLNIPNHGDVYDIFKTKTLPKSYHVKEESPDSPSEDGYETAEESFISEKEFMYPKSNLFDEDDEEEEKPVPTEKIMKRIDSHKGMRSYQLAQQLHSKWTTGAGPRISCMRDYPSELQFRVLQQASLSPRALSPFNASPRTPAARGSMGRSPLASETAKP